MPGLAMRIDPFPNESFDPATLAVLYRAYDDAWANVASHLDSSLHVLARNLIANTIMIAAEHGERDPERLWCMAVSKARAVTGTYWTRSFQLANQPHYRPLQRLG